MLFHGIFHAIIEMIVVVFLALVCGNDQEISARIDMITVHVSRHI